MHVEMPASLSDLRRHDDLVIPTDDGDVRAVRYEPVEHPESAPVLLMYMPYRNEDFAYGRYDPFLQYLAAHGYEVVSADVVGTGGSGGRKPRPHMPSEGKQAATLVERLAAAEWSNGDVGMVGFSYGGRACLMAAAEGPDPLKAIAPMHSAPIVPHDRFGGTFGFYDRVKWGSMQQTIQAVPPTVRDPDGRWAGVWRQHLAELEEGVPWLFQFLDPDRTPGRAADPELSAADVEVPTFAVSGWRDYFPRQTLEFVRDVRAPTRVVLGPWRHVFPHLGRETAVDYRRQVVRWFDRFLKGQHNGVDDGPSISFWTEREGGGTVDGGVWRATDTWPETDDGETLSFALTPDGLETAEDYEDGVLEREYDHDHTVGVHSMGPRFLQCEPFDTGTDDARSATFDTEPLSDPVEITGTGEATVRVTPTTRDPVVAVRVVDVGPGGDSTLVTHGQVAFGDDRDRHANEFSEPDSLEAGQQCEVRIPLKPTSHVFEAGHRIRVAIAGSFFPLLLPPREQGSFTLHSTPGRPSHVEFPGRELQSSTAFDDEVSMDGPDDRVPVAPADVDYLPASWEVSHDQMSDRARVTVTSGWNTDVRNADADLTYESELVATVSADDPSTAAVRCRNELTVEFGTESVFVVGTARVTRDASQATTRVTIDGETAFEETWRL